MGECNCRWLDALQWWAQGCDRLQVVAPCYGGLQLQMARRLLMVGFRLRSAASGEAKENANNCRWLQTPYNAGLKVAISCKWWRRVIGECYCRRLRSVASGGAALSLYNDGPKVRVVLVALVVLVVLVGLVVLGVLVVLVGGLVKGSLEDTSELRRVEKRWDWKVT